MMLGLQRVQRLNKTDLTGREEAVALLVKGSPVQPQQGGADAPSLPLCSLQLIDAGSLLPFSLPAQCRAQLCHWELHQYPVCCWELRAAQRSLATFTPSLCPAQPHRADREKELYGQRH
ncbi:unnamed protein product [Pleuronectes platessa]|uniref:Uncharacterized protein n=1 Tax=Pleuronectes platessa TaxID=8262 RepID=A0A9N7ZF17_PLEPL|nr:unnamed protein product [Pleuronectes platessa]